MQKKDHIMLASLVLEQSGTRIPATCRKAYLYGNIAPDLHPATYLHGMSYGQKFHGHNYENILPIMVKIIEKLKNTKGFHEREYLLLGKLSHYIVDSFTYPHNIPFKGSIPEHCEYEDQLHARMPYFCMHPPKYGEFELHTIDLRVIEEMHMEYIKVAGDYQTDFLYALQALSYAFGFVSMKCPAICRKNFANRATTVITLEPQGKILGQIEFYGKKTGRIKQLQT